MKAAYYMGNKTIKIGECVRVKPKSNEVEIKVAYCGICGTDLHIFNGEMDKRVTIPHIMGHECSGVVSEVGEGVEHIKPGDKVVVRPLGSCGKCPACTSGLSHICYNLNFLGVDSPGAMQSYWTVPAELVHKVPETLDLKYAALIEPLAVASHDVRMGDIKENEKVVVIGGGPIGILIALVARSIGAEVIISEVNPNRLDFANRLGFKTVNAREDNIVEYVDKWTEGRGADVVFEVSASDAGAQIMTELLRTRGRIVVVGIFSHSPRVNLHKVFWRELQLCGARVYEKEDYENAIKLAASNALPLESLITRVEPLERLQQVMEEMISVNQNGMKTLIRCW